MIGITIGVPFGAGEIFARIMTDPPVDRFKAPESWAQFDPEIGWAAKTGTYASEEPGNAQITYWPSGRRATREDENAKADRPAMVVVGDSWSMGYGVADEETFAWQLDAAIPDIAVENFGAGGYSSYQAYLMLERALGLLGSRARFVSFGLTSFMVNRDISYYSHAKSIRTLSSQKIYLPPLPIVNDGGTVSLTPPIVTEKWPLEDKSALINVLHNAFFWAYLKEREVSSKVDGLVTLNILKMANELTARKGITFSVLILEDSPPVPTISAALSEAGIPWLNCNQQSAQTPEMRVGNDTRYHPNGRLNALFANCIQRGILASHPH